jgi:hypothetical protein
MPAQPTYSTYVTNVTNPFRRIEQSSAIIAITPDAITGDRKLPKVKKTGHFRWAEILLENIFPMPHFCRVWYLVWNV